MLFRGPSRTEKHGGVKLILDQHMGQHDISYLLHYCSQFSVKHEYISCQINFHYKTNESCLFDISENYFVPFDLFDNLSSFISKNGIDIKIGTYDYMTNYFFKSCWTKYLKNYL